MIREGGQMCIPWDSSLKDPPSPQKDNCCYLLKMEVYRMLKSVFKNHIKEFLFVFDILGKGKEKEEYDLISNALK